MADVTILSEYKKSTRREGTDEGVSVARDADFADRIKLTGSDAKGFTYISSSDLYSDAEVASFEVTQAMSLLREGAQCLDDAENALYIGAVLESDMAVERFFALLPELFCCRGIGDGYAAVVQAMHYSLYNNKGMPIDLARIRALKGCVRSLLSGVFVAFDRALNFIHSLESAGFNVEPDILEVVSEILTDESLS